MGNLLKKIKIGFGLLANQKIRRIYTFSRVGYNKKTENKIILT